MASDRHHSSHPLPEPSAPVLSLPSVAELLASSRPNNPHSISPRQHQHHQHQDPRFAPAPAPASHSSPPAVSSYYSPANGASAAEPSVSSTLHHASQASPTDTTTSTSPLDHQQQHHYHYSYAPPPKNHFNSSLSTHPNESLQEPSHSQVPVNAHRQDSAVSQQRVDIARANRVSASPSEFAAYHSHRSPSSSRQSTSPRPSTNSNSSSSVHPIGTTSYSNQPNHQQPGNYPPRRASANSPSASHPNIEGSKPYEVLAPVAPSQQEPTNGSNTRQSRYNVRFAANHTPDNMSSLPKPRQDPIPAPPTVEPSASEPRIQEETKAPADEPAIQMIKNVPHADDQPQAPSRNSDGSVERCSGCGATWSRPLPDKLSEPQRSPGSTLIGSFAQANLNMLAVLAAHGRKADAQYDKWKWEHSHCIQNGHSHRNRSSSPYYTSSSETAKSRSTDGPPRETDGSESASNKRKAEDSAREEHLANTKQRRVTLDAAAAGPAAPVQSSTS